MRRWTTALLLGLLPAGPAIAHDAFGDLGPFYANLLHPLADPAQGLLIVGFAVLLARQRLATVRAAYAAFALAAAATILLDTLVALDPPGPRMTGLLAAVLGATAVLGTTLGPLPATLLAAAIAVAVGLAIDLPPGPRAAGLSAFGAMLGIALATLLVWGLVDTARRQFGSVAGAVAGSWVAAAGVMAAALAAG